MLHVREMSLNGQWDEFVESRIEQKRTWPYRSVAEGRGGFARISCHPRTDVRVPSRVGAS